MSAGPSPMLVAHLALVGKWCPGHRCDPHYHDVLTARTGTVLCIECSDTVESERRPT